MPEDGKPCEFLIAMWTLGAVDLSASNALVRHSDAHVRPYSKCSRGEVLPGVQACLRLVEKRETRYRVQWYYRLFEETQRGLSWGTSVEVVHGSLLALGELLRHTGRPLPLPDLTQTCQCYLHLCC